MHFSSNSPEEISVLQLTALFPGALNLCSVLYSGSHGRLMVPVALAWAILTSLRLSTPFQKPCAETLACEDGRSM